MKLKKIDKQTPPMQPRDLLRELLQVVRLQKARWGFGLFASQGIALLEAGFIAVLYLLVDSGKRVLVQQKTISLLARFHEVWEISDALFLYLLFGMSLIFLALVVILKHKSEVNLQKLQQDLCLHFSKRIIEIYLRASLTLSRKIGKERIVSSIIYDCRTLGDSARKMLDLVGATGSFLLFVIGACFLSLKILLVAGLVYILPLWINRRGYRKIRKISSVKVTTQEELLSYFTDTLSGLERIKLDALENTVLEKSKTMIHKDWDWREEQHTIKSKVKVSMDGLAFLGLLLILFGGVVILHEKLSTLMVLFVVFNRIKTQTTLFSTTYLKLGEKMPNVYRYFNLSRKLESKQPCVEAPESLGFRSIDMKQVFFGYDGAPVLKGIDLQAEAGDRILIQGPSGHGKSTLLEILSGLLPPTEGFVSIDGRVFDEVLFYKIRHQIAYVSPEVYLFEGTLKNNLLIGCPEKEMELQRVLAFSGLDLALRDLPLGLETPLGRNGNALSLGQRARVILARLYLKNPRMILMDEATANLDPLLEEQMMQNLESHLDPKAILILVAHKAPKGMKFNKHFRIETGHLIAVPPEGIMAE